MKNADIIKMAKKMHDIEEEAHTFAQWQKKGLVVRKGEHAAFKAKIWLLVKEYVEVEDGEFKQIDRFVLKQASFFTASQVEGIGKEVVNAEGDVSRQEGALDQLRLRGMEADGDNGCVGVHIARIHSPAGIRVFGGALMGWVMDGLDTFDIEHAKALDNAYNMGYMDGVADCIKAIKEILDGIDAIANGGNEDVAS